MRESTSRRAAIDIDDFERRLRAPSAPRQSPGDPLSELARLMQGEDAAEPARRLDRLFSVETPKHQAPRRDAPAHEADAYGAELRGAFDEDRVIDHEAAAAQSEADFAHAATEHFYAERADHPTSAHGGDAAAGAWEDDASTFLDYGENEPEALASAEKPGLFAGLAARLRPWHAVVGLSLLGVGAIAYGFAHRSGVVGSREIATIAAPEGPVKVPPAAEAEANPERPDSAVLDRQEAAPVKGVVTRQEQPVEPIIEAQTQQPLLGEPKRVKTVSVRPDGTLIENAPTPTAVARASAPPASEAPVDRAATTPKAAVKPVTTPKPDRATPAAAKPKPAQKVAATEPQQPAAEPAENDDNEAAASEAAPSSGKGGFAVQFGAAGSEAEARALMNKIATKYGSRLGGHRPTFKIAKVGDKTVYRVRVHDVSKEAAAKVCSEVKAGGDACFVAAGAN